jgi:hypothetical protein
MLDLTGASRVQVDMKEVSAEAVMATLAIGAKATLEAAVQEGGSSAWPACVSGG